MKIRKKKLISLFWGTTALALIAGQSFAAVTCLDATIDQANVTPWDLTWASNFSIKATCNDTTPAWSGSLEFYIRNDADLIDSYYATALTAMSTGKHVTLKLAGATEYSLIHEMKLLSSP